MPASNSNSSATAAPAVQFKLSDDIRMDKGHTLDQLMSQFHSLKDGLPELIKNSKDQYSRKDLRGADDRQIVVLINTPDHRLGVLDFAGAEKADFDGWETWSSRTEARGDDDIEAGHGNGGKGFMVRGAEKSASIESAFQGRFTRMGFVNNVPARRYHSGFAIDETGALMDSVDETHPEKRLGEFLALFSLPLVRLPAAAQRLFAQRRAYTGVVLEGVHDWRHSQARKVKRLAAAVPSIIASHGQTALTIETSQVWVVIDGEIVTKQPVRPTELEPYPGFESTREFEIPDVLPDPETRDSVDIKLGLEGARTLTLRTSKRQMQMSEDLKPRNVLRLSNGRNIVATWPLHNIGVPSAQVAFIYGEIKCPSLRGEHLAGADRINTNDTPLTRALREFARQHVETLAEELYESSMKNARPHEREQAELSLQGIRNLMRRYLDVEASGDGDDDPDGPGGINNDGGSGVHRHHTPVEYGTRLDEIVLEPTLDALAFALGTRVPLRARFIERHESGATKPVRRPALLLKADPPGFVTLEPDNKVAAVAEATGEIWLETTDGAVISNRLLCEVVKATSAILSGPGTPLKQGEKVRLAIEFTTDQGPRTDLLVDGTVEPADLGKVGRAGVFTAGFKEATAEIAIDYGHGQTRARVEIGAERVEPPKSQGGAGFDVPYILFCGTPAPGTEGRADHERTVAGGEHLPTITEDPRFQQVVWINATSKESMRVRHGGPSGSIGLNTKTYLNFVALKCFEILKRLKVRQQIAKESITEFQFMLMSAQAEMDCADFIDAAWLIGEEMTRKEASRVQGQ